MENQDGQGSFLCGCVICAKSAQYSDSITSSSSGLTPVDISWIGFDQKTKLDFLAKHFFNIDSGYRHTPGSTITYSFLSESSQASGLFNYERIPAGESFKFLPLPEITKQTFREALAFLENFINLKFKEVSPGSGSIRIGIHNTSVGGYASYPNESPQMLWIDDSYINGADISYEGYSVLWHELGHTLGLQHPQNYGNDSGSGGSLSNGLDINLLTKMSYYNVFVKQRLFAPLDIYALLKMYGSPSAQKGITYEIDPYRNGKQYIDYSDSKFINGVGWGRLHDNPLWITGTKGNDELIILESTYPSIVLKWYLDSRSGYLTVGERLQLTDGNIQNRKFPLTFIPTYKNDFVQEKPVVGGEDLFQGMFYLMPADNQNTFAFEKVVLPSGEDTILIGDYFSKISSGAGNDTFTGFQSGVSIDGGAGADSLFITGNSSSYIVDGIRIKSNLDQINATPMSISSIERIIFSDKELNTTSDLRGNPGQIYRVYKAVFNRDPMTNDMKGLGYWIKQTDNGMQLQEVAARFIDSNEFRALYGTNPTNSEYLTKVYSNVLGRTPDKAGFDWWLSEMNTNPTKTKVKVLTDFSESPENQQGVAALIGNGIVFEPWTG